MRIVVAKRGEGQFYARVTTMEGVVVRMGSNQNTKEAAVSALVQKNLSLFGIAAFIDTTGQQMVPPPKQTSPS